MAALFIIEYRSAVYYRCINGLHACGICTKKHAENQDDG
jgi:hypothetical protein